jgi:hypothetical protein
MSRVLGPLPENAFVASARENIPAIGVRVTTSSTRGNLRGRGRGRSCATREPAKRKEPAGEASTTRGRGRGKKKTPAQATTSDAQEPARTSRRGYNIGQGSTYYMLFGDDEQQPRPTSLPDLNAELVPDLNVQEFALSQNAPHDGDV